MQPRSFWKHRVDSDASSPASQAGRQPVMGPCSEDPHLCGASRLLGFTSLLLSVCCTGVKSSVAPDPGVQDSGVHVPLQGIRGGSVLFHVPKKQEAEPEEVSWGFGPESNYRVFMRVHRGKDTPTWVSLQDKYQQRVHVPNVTSLRIENLIPEDSGQYRARASFIGGIEFNQVFLLTVYDPAPLPHILVKSASFTAGWCNATLECTAPGDTEDLKVTWEIKGLPKELEQRVTSELPSNSWKLTLSLPLSQPNGSLTCVVSNQVGQKTATLDLGEVCVSGSPGNNGAKTLPGIIGAVVIMLLIIVTGLFLWKTYAKKRKMKTERGVEFQDDQRDNDGGVQYAELSQQGSGEVTNKGAGKQHLEEKEPGTVYSEVYKPEREAMKII
ncbi:PREDICTED: CXADR-like membrane protein isoform X1 [Capra hircus]|uniref:CXADR-like membrane protein isoform X1 n=1 Tax=Capra hircus TaxID=9925 RepID=UPI0008468A17|nr:PREDICTED: CXADR-like membrane protein isoform X1 [Capra hircus]